MAKVNIKFEGKDLKGLKRLTRHLAELKTMQTKVGVFGGRHPVSGESIPAIAMKHEFGSNSPHSFSYKGKKVTIKGVPTRSFIRMPILTRRLKVVGDKDFMKKYVIYALQTGNINVPLEIMGRNAEAVIQQAFDTGGFGKWKRNMSKEYIALKGSDTPLIDTGFLRSAVTSKVSKK